MIRRPTIADTLGLPDVRPPDAADRWRSIGWAQVLAAMISEAVPMRLSRRAGMIFRGDAGAAQVIPVMPSLAVSVDTASGNGPRQTLRPQAPGRVVPAPLP